MYNSRITSMTTLQMVSMGIVMKEMTASARVRWNTRKCTFVRLTRSTLQIIHQSCSVDQAGLKRTEA